MLEGILRFVDRLEPRRLVQVTSAHWAGLLIVVLMSIYVGQLIAYGPDVMAWDLLLVTGCTTVAVGIGLANGLARRMDWTLERLDRRGTLEFAGGSGEAFRRSLAVHADVWAHRGGLLIAAIILVIYVRVFGLHQFFFTGASTIAGYVVGRYLGRMLCYGCLGWFLRRAGATAKVHVGHPDGAAGLKPLGDFYLLQALLLLIAITYLAGWYLLFALPLFHDYSSRWRDSYLALLLLTLVIEIGAFILPMVTVHEDMVRQKEELQARADERSREIEALYHQLAEGKDATRRAEVQEQLDRYGAQFQAIEELPTWPVDRSIPRRFTISNLAVFIPVAVQAIGATGSWSALATALQEFFAQRQP